MTKPEKVYLDFDPAKGYPMAADLYWECLRCGMTLPSAPDDAVSCLCLNIIVDTSRTTIVDPTKARLFRKR